MAQDSYQLVTDRIVAALDEGIVPWSKPWRAVAGYGPSSLSTGKPYHGVNVMILGSTQVAKGYESNYWTTYKGAQGLGGNVLRGEKATPVVFWKFLDKVNETGEKTGTIPMLRTFSVFNADQCDGVNTPPREETPAFDPIERAEAISTHMPMRPEVKHSPEDRAYYSPNLDYVHLPLPGLFESQEAYYGTMFHELIHATGHSSRLDRAGVEGSHSFGSENYAREELVAEIGAAFVCGECDLTPRVEQSASYIAGWLKALKDDRKLIVSASSQATKAANYILGVSVAVDREANTTEGR